LDKDLQSYDSEEYDESSSSSSDSQYMTVADVTLYEFEYGDEHDDDEEDEDIGYIVNQKRSSSEGMEDVVIDEISKKNDGEESQSYFKRRSHQVDKRMTTETHAATASLGVSKSDNGRPSSRHPRISPRRCRRGRSRTPPRGIKSAITDLHSRSVCSLEEISVDKADYSRPSMGEMVLHDLEDEGIFDEELQVALIRDYSSQHTLSPAPPFAGKSNRRVIRSRNVSTIDPMPDSDEIVSPMRPSIRKLALHDLADEGIPSDNKLKEALRDDVFKQASPKSTTSRRGGRKLQASVVDSSEDDMSDFWSESLPDFPASTNHTARRKNIPINLRIDQFSDSQKQLGINSDHGVIHDFDPNEDDSSIDDSSFGGSSTSIEYTSVESESSASDIEPSIFHQRLSTRATALARVSLVGTLRPLNSHHSLPDMPLFREDDDEESSVIVEEFTIASNHTNHSRSIISQSQSTTASNDDSVLWKCFQVQTKLKRLQAPDLSTNTLSVQGKSRHDFDWSYRTNGSSQSTASRQTTSGSKHACSTISSLSTADKSILLFPSTSSQSGKSNSNSSSLKGKQSHADLSGHKLREAFHNLGLLNATASKRLSSRSLCSRE